MGGGKLYAVPGRSASWSGVLISARWREVNARKLGSGFADGKPCHGSRRADVLLEEGGRNAQCSRDVAEAVDLDVGGQVFGGIDLDAEQVPDRRGVFRAGQPLNGYVARHRRLAAGIDRPFEPADEAVDARFLRPRAAGRRHETAAQLAHGRFEGFGVLRDGVRRQPFEHDAARKLGFVVALRAIGFEQAPVLRGTVGKRRKQIDADRARNDRSGHADRNRNLACLPGCEHPIKHRTPHRSRPD